MLPNYLWLDPSKCFDCAIIDSGWYALIRNLFREIDGVLDSSGAFLEARQIKEKLGTLRFYYRLHGASGAQENAIRVLCEGAYERSSSICIECGQPGRMPRQTGWIAPFCDRHALHVHFDSLEDRRSLKEIVCT